MPLVAQISGADACLLIDALDTFNLEFMNQDAFYVL